MLYLSQNKKMLVKMNYIRFACCELSFSSPEDKRDPLRLEKLMCIFKKYTLIFMSNLFFKLSLNIFQS